MKRKTFSATVKARAVIEAIRGEKTLNEIASSYGVCHLQPKSEP